MATQDSNAKRIRELQRKLDEIILLDAQPGSPSDKMIDSVNKFLRQ